MIKCNRVSADRNPSKIQVSSTTTCPITAERDVSIEWCRLSAMMIRAIVENTVWIESFKNMSMPMYIPCLLEVKDGGWARAKKSKEGNLSCSILVRFFQLTLKLAKLNSNSIVNLHALTSWKLLKGRSSIRPTKAIWQDLSTIPANLTASHKNGTFLDRSVSVFLLWEISKKIRNLPLTISLMYTVHLWLNVFVGPKNAKGTWDLDLLISVLKNGMKDLRIWLVRYVRKISMTTISNLSFAMIAIKDFTYIVLIHR